MGNAPANITARGWGWQYANRVAPALSGLDFDLASGERVLLLGASGAGKSTLLAGVAGVLGGVEDGEHSGKLLVDGVRPELARGRVGLVLQDPDAQTVLARVGDEVAFACENLGLPREEIWRRVHEALFSVGLNLPLSHPTAHLSGGQKQRLALASVLAMKPGLLLLDEPTANLDTDGVRQVYESVAHLVANRETSLLVVEHRVEIWMDLVDRVVVLSPGGGVLIEGEPEQIFTNQGLELAQAGIWVPGHHPRVTRAPSPEGSVLLQAESLAVGRRRRGEKQAVAVAEKLSATVRGSRALAVVGSNGSGKSTLALTFAGLLAPLSGKLFAGDTLSAGLAPEPFRWRSAELFTRIGTVFQNPEHQFLCTTVREELELAPRVQGKTEKEIAATRDELASSLGLADLLPAHPFTLSGGEKRRLSVAITLSATVQVLIADEPSFGQDARTWAELVRFFGEFVYRGAALVIVTHDTELVDALADQVLEMGAS